MGERRKTTQESSFDGTSITPMSVLKGTRKVPDLVKAHNKRLPQNVSTNTAQASGCTPSDLRYYLDKRLPVKNNVVWNEYVSEHFDSIVNYTQTTSSSGEKGAFVKYEKCYHG